jgi:hypothetical protein
MKVSYAVYAMGLPGSGRSIGVYTGGSSSRKVRYPRHSGNECQFCGLCNGASMKRSEHRSRHWRFVRRESKAWYPSNQRLLKVRVSVQWAERPDTGGSVPKDARDIPGVMSKLKRKSVVVWGQAQCSASFYSNKNYGHSGQIVNRLVLVEHRES